MITIAKTALAFHDLASWNIAALTIGRRACSSLRHRQIDEAWHALPLELIETCDDPAALVALERVADDLVSKARAAAHEKAQRQADERQRQANEKALAVLAEACAFLPRDLADAITARPDLERLAFVEGIVAGIRR
jgi:hypothetical protein